MESLFTLTNYNVQLRNTRSFIHILPNRDS
jgi:hypothetical protein